MESFTYYFIHFGVVWKFLPKGQGIAECYFHDQKKNSEK